MSQQTYPVANPTWYDTVRNMFDATDVAHMLSQGLNLKDYNTVKATASGIYSQVASGNMPPGNPWSPDKVQTFLNWLSNGCPKGTPAKKKTVGLAFASSVATRIRKEITELSPAELDKLTAAFEGIMALDNSDPNSYFVQAGYHWLPAPTYCQHHVPAYNPWHRAYLMSFENALRSIPGCEDVTLPYWDVTTPFPDVLKQPPFASYTLPEDIGQGYNAGYTTQRYPYPTIESNLQRHAVTADINRAMVQTDWDDFHGMFGNPPSPNNTIISAHDNGHVSIGPTMASQSVAAYDPVFWFFHSDWDRLFWNWQKKMDATDLPGLLSTIDQTTDPLSYQIFTNPVLETLPPFTDNPPKLTTVTIIDSVNSLDVDYQNPASFKALAMRPKSLSQTAASEKFSINSKLVNVRVKGLNRLKIPGSFTVHLQKDGEVIASKAMFQPEEVEKCPNCVDNAVVNFDFEMPLKEVSNGKLDIWVEPLNKDFVGDRFPHKMMGNPTIDVHFMLDHD